MSDQSRSNEDDLPSIEAKLIEQDHRLFKVLWTFFWERRKWDKEDPRRKAALHAFLWQFITPGSIIATGGGLIAAFTLVVLVKQTELAAQQTEAVISQTQLFEKQNELFNNQNRDLKEQIAVQKSQFDTQRVTELLTYLYDGEELSTSYECLEGQRKFHKEPSYNARIRSDAFSEYVKLANSDSNLVDLENAILSEVTLRSGRFKKLNLRCADFTQSRQFGTRYAEEVMLTWADFSSSYLEDVRFRDSDLRWANFSGAIITAVEFSKVNSHNLRFDGAKISNTSLSSLDLRSSSFKNVDFHNVDFSDSYLDNVDFSGAKCRGCNFDGIKGRPKDGLPQQQ